MDDLVYIPVGSDRFEAQLIAEACLAEGYEVKLLLADDSGYGALQSHRLLVHSDDVVRIQALIDKTTGGPS